jgi:hypothetical protein
MHSVGEIKPREDCPSVWWPACTRMAAPKILLIGCTAVSGAQPSPKRHCSNSNDHFHPKRSTHSHSGRALSWTWRDPPENCRCLVTNIQRLDPVILTQPSSPSPTWPINGRISPAHVQTLPIPHFSALEGMHQQRNHGQPLDFGPLIPGETQESQWHTTPPIT